MVGLKELDQFDYGEQFIRGPQSVTQQSGLAGLAAPAISNIARANQQTLDRMRDFGSLRLTPPQAPATPAGPSLAISRSTGQIWANGKLFSRDDAQAALESEQYLSQPPAPPPPDVAQDWEELDPEAYAQLLGGIKNPSLGTLASKNFGIGVDNMQMLAGYGMQFLGAEETGQAVVRQQLEDINKNAPYQRNFTDIGSDENRGVLDWFVANLAQQGPNLVESVVTAAIGAGAGALAGGGPNPASAAGGLVTAMVGKQAFKQALLSAAKKYTAGEVLDAAEKKLLYEAAGLTAAGIREAAEKAAVSRVTVNAAGEATAPTVARSAAQFFVEDIAPQLGAAATRTTAAGKSQAMLGGAAIASLGQNYATGVSDMYGESVEGGTPDRGLSALAGVPYAAMETLPEFIAAMRIFKGIGARTTALAGKTGLGKAGEIGIRAGQGAAAGAALEGMTELGQESLGIGMNAAVDFDSPEGISRLINAFAAGAAIGGFIGAGSNLNTGKPHDLLSAGTKPADQGGQTVLSGEVIPPTRPSSPIGPDGSVPLLGGPGEAAMSPMLGGPAPAGSAAPGPTVTDVQFAQPQVGAPVTPVSPTPGQTQPNMLAGPLPQLQGPAPAPQAPPAAATPPVIPMGGQIGGSALQQAATGQLQGGVPPVLPNRLQQQQAAIRQQQLEATSGSALARLGRGDLPIPVTQPGGAETIRGEATGQMVEPIRGKAKLKRGKKVMQVQGMPQEEVAPAPVVEEVQPNAAQVRPQPADNKLQRQEVAARRKAAKAGGGDSLKRGAKAEAKAQPQAEQQPRAEVTVASTKRDLKRGVTVVTLSDGRTVSIAKEKGGGSFFAGWYLEGVGDRPSKQMERGYLGSTLEEAKAEIAKLASEGRLPQPDTKTSKIDTTAKAPEGGKQDVPPKVEKPKEGPIPKAEGAAAAPASKAEEPKNAVAVYNPARIVDPEKEAFEKAKRRAELRDEADFDTTDEEMVQDYIDLVDSAQPGSVEYNDALHWLLDAKMTETSKPLKKKINDYLTDRFTPEEIAFHTRTMKEAPTQGSLDFDSIVTAMEQVNNGARLPQSVIGQLTAAWKRLKPSDPNFGTGKLADYIKGGPQFFNTDKSGKVVPKQPGRYSISMWDKPDNPLAVGKIKLVIGKFLSRYANKPKVHVYRDQADLKASNPDLYKRMVAGRPQGDFDTVSASGYSLGDEIIIFSDRIGSEQHLAFVLAHETLGHFGMRGLMGSKDFNALMTKLYDTDSRLKIGVDAAMAARGLSKAEAVEEYLSDYAAQLHTSLVRRVWKGIKGVLNRVGIQFGDEATRYFLDQAKRYVKTGQRAGVFETSSVLHRLQAVETGAVGRFSVVEVADENERVADLIRRNRIMPTNLKDAGRIFKDGGWTWDTFKEKFFSLANFQALRNPGLYQFEKLLDETRQREAYIYNRYNVKLQSLFNKSEAHRERVSRALIGGRVVSVYRLLNNPLTTADSKQKLFNITETGDLELNVTTADEYIQRGLLSFEEMRDGVTVEREIMGPDGKPVKDTYSFPGLEGITEDEYNDYALARRTMAEVEIELLRAKYANYVSSEKVSAKAIRRMLKNSNATDAERMVKRTANKYKEIYASGYTVDERGNMQPGIKEIERADEFLQAVNRALISADAKNDPAVREFFDNQKQADDFIATINDFRTNRKVPSGELTYLFQNEMKRVVLDDVNLGVEEDRAKRSMAGGYVPIIRDKPFEMRVEAFDTDGKPIKLHDDMRSLLVYSQFDSISQAERAYELLAEEFEGKTFEVWADKGNGFYETVTATLRPVYGPALTEVATDPALNLDEFLHGLRLFKINLSPDKMAKVIQELTSSGDQLRKRLEFSNTPGYDKNIGVFAMARHIQLRGSTIAKTVTRPRLRNLLDRSNPESRDLWNGDAGSVFSLYNRWTGETDPARKQHYRHQLDFHLSMFRETFPGMKAWDGSRAEYDRLRAAGGMSQNNSDRFYSSAQRTMEFLEANRLVTESNFGAGKMASGLRAGTSILQLGGSLAQGVMNMVSPYTNWLPYMASYNAKNGFGGGFSVGQVMAAYQRALNQVGTKGLLGGKYNTAEFYEQLTESPDTIEATYGLTVDEAVALAAEIREGKLIPAQSNALLGTARAGITNRFLLRGIDTFMAPFNMTEQASRRAAFLAAYRLAKQRNGANDPALMARQNTREGRDERDELLGMARDFAVQSLDLTLGEYSVLNRPPAWRDGIQSFLYMYKVYPTTTIQLLRRLDKKGQVIMLGTLWLFSGVAGFPFAEDIEDLIDTIAQALGLQMPSVRAEFVKMLEGIAPGLSPYVLKGAINTALGIPADVASRFSQGDFIPGTGILLAGSTVGQEVKDILGPMPAMVLGAAGSVRDLVSVPFSESKTVQGALRAAPITAARMLGDSWAYLENNAVVDRRGYIVSPEMGLGTVAMRLMGFYPKAAANQYEAIKIAKRINNYQKEMVAGFRMAWVREYNARNYAGMRQIEQTVEEWNRAAKGTGLEISNFRKNSLRAAKEANMSAAERTLRATSKAGREDTSRLLEYLIAE